MPVAMLDEDEDEHMDEVALRQLTEMGFPESRAAKALRLNQYVGPGAALWGYPSIPYSLTESFLVIFKEVPRMCVLEIT